MKKLLLVCCVVFIAIGATSCKKNYACNCEYTDAAGDKITDELPIGETKKKVAKDACDIWDTQYKSMGTDGKCTLVAK